MEQYISKSAIVAEIKKKIRTEQGYSSGDAECGYRDCAKEILSFIDNLETKEVDDEKCKEYNKALSIAKAWYKSSDSSAQERNVARMIMGDKVREEL